MQGVKYMVCIKQTDDVSVLFSWRFYRRIWVCSCCAQGVNIMCLEKTDDHVYRGRTVSRNFVLVEK